MQQTNVVSTNFERAFRQWQNDLLDASKRNQLLYFKPGTRSLQIEEPAPTALFQILTSSARQQLIKLPLDEDETGNQLTLPGTASPPVRKLRKDEILVGRPERGKAEALLTRLRQRSRSSLVEKGIRALYVSFGVLRWREASNSDSEVLSPLLLLPMDLDRDSSLAPFKLTPLEDEPVLNPTLVRQLEIQAKLRLNLSLDDDTSLEAALEAIRIQIANYPQWTVTEESFLGLFSFEKWAMYVDLERRKREIAAHPVVQAITGNPSALPPVLGLPDPRELDEIPPTETFQVLDADASQQAAIATVLTGSHLAIQGPPGTGKSQTITNLIAELLARGKKVLFVSEKVTAMRVVEKRLRQAGLGEFCLLATGRKEAAKSIVRELSIALDETAPSHTSALAALTRVARRREELNDYVRTLHADLPPMNLSVFYAHGQLAALVHVPDGRFHVPNLETMTQEKLDEWRKLVRDLAQFGHVLEAAKAHPWRDLQTEDLTFADQVALRADLESLWFGADELAEIVGELNQQWGLETATCASDAEWWLKLLDVLSVRQPVPEAWLRPVEFDSRREMLGQYGTAANCHRTTKDDLRQKYDVGLFTLDLAEISRVFRAGGEAGAALLAGTEAPLDRLYRQRDQLASALEGLQQTAKALLHAGGSLASSLGMPGKSVADLEVVCELVHLLLRDPKAQPEWFGFRRNAELKELADLASSHVRIIAENRETLAQAFTDAIFAIDPQAMLERFQSCYGGWTKHFKGSYRRDRAALQGALRASGRLDDAEAVAALRSATAVISSEAWFRDAHVELAGVFARNFSGASTDWTAVHGALETAHTISQLLGEAPPPQVIAAASGNPSELARLRGGLTAVDQALGDYRKVLASLADLLPKALVEGSPLGNARVGAVAQWAEAILEPLREFWEAAASVRNLAKHPDPQATELAADVRDAEDVRRYEQDFSERADDLAAELGPHFHGLETRFDEALAALDWSERLQSCFGNPLPQSFIDQLQAGQASQDGRRADLRRVLDGLLPALHALRPQFGPELISTPFEQTPAETIREWATAKVESIGSLPEWLEAQRIYRNAIDAGLGEFVTWLAQVQPPVQHWENAFLKRFWTLWISWQYHQHPKVGRFTATAQDGIRREFQQLDRQQLEIARKRVVSQVFGYRRPVADATSSASAPGILRAQAQRMRRFMPPRRLFARIQSLLVELKPCLMMNPLNVAEYLGETDLVFDTVIFDEASQVRPADAIGAISRARQVVIVGDTKQLPPSNFFDVSLSSDDDDGDGDDELPESILSAVLPHLSMKYLAWHYRSRNEALIAFSNVNFYTPDHLRLTTFPTPDAGIWPVEYVHVPDGIYDRGGEKHNRKEAEQLVTRVIEERRRHPEKSFGVVAFSLAQKLAIETECERRIRDDPSLQDILARHEDEDEGFFVKALEEVQGDERDVILFSVGYGPDAAGKFTMNFGPLNRQGGERRLNVAITRARERNIIFASVRPERIAVDGKSPAMSGVAALRDYLEFAEAGSQWLVGKSTVTNLPAESPFEEAVIEALTREGLAVTPQLGVSGYRIDIAVKDPLTGRYVLGVECDGATYHSAATARERDRLRQEVLENLGWTIHRIWSTEWLRDPVAETRKVVEAYTAARTKVPCLTGSVHRPPPAIHAGASVPTADLPAEEPDLRVPEPRNPVVQPWQPARIPRKGNREKLISVVFAEELALLVLDVVRQESPVHRSRLATAIGAAYDVQRLTARVSEIINRGIRRALTKNLVDQRGEFLWFPGMTEPPVRGPAVDGTVRPIEHIAPEEIDLLLERTLRREFSTSQDDLVKAAARVLGFERTGGKINSALEASLQRLVARGIISQAGGVLTCSRRIPA
ncbi:MAG: DUF3320 domain-containing protein [Dehalococcoidia bacterium]